MESGDQVRSRTAAASYPPHGRRGIGAERATAWSRGIPEHVAMAQDILVVPLIESVQGGEHAAEMAMVDGVDLFFIGPADWSATAGQAGGWAGGAVGESIIQTCRTIRAHGKQVGVLATTEEDLRARRQQGFRMLGLGIDGALLLRGLEQMLPATGALRALSTTMEPCPIGIDSRPLTELPAVLRGDRRERVITSAQAPRVVIDQGVEITSLVGPACGARGFCTSLARFAPGGSLIAHRHPQPETVVVIHGAIITQMAGRIHRLEPGDSLVIPAGMPHRTGNADASIEALIHVAMPSEGISRTAEDPASWPSGVPATSDAPGIRRRTDDAVSVHAGAAAGDGGIRCRTLALARGASAAPRVHDVDTAVVVLAGSIRCLTGQGVLTAGSLSALHLPRGTIYTLEADHDADAMVIETCADAFPLGAVCARSCLTPVPGSAVAASAAASPAPTAIPAAAASAAGPAAH